jgi:hypothetical protein
VCWWYYGTFGPCRCRRSGAATATALGDDDTWACMGFGMIVERRSWKSAFALVS